MALQLHHFSFNAMACRNELSLYCKGKQLAREIADQAIAVVNTLEQRYSRYLPDSILSQINTSSGQIDGIDIDAETAALLNYAQTCYQQSDGLFDVTSGVLRKIWDFKKNIVPRQQDIDDIQQSIGWNKVSWASPRITLPIQGMELDFGGIVKEYAADSCANLCRSLGIKSGIVNMGGDIHAIGPHADGSPWVIGIQDPRNPDNIISSIKLKQGGLASSGDYQRCMVVDGKRYSHILNPKTGWPVEGLRAVSVVGPHCLIAGSTSTIAMLKGEAGKQWLNTTGMPYLWIDEQGQCFRRHL